MSADVAQGSPPPAASDGTYQYEPVDIGSIRVLYLLEADEFGDDLECAILHVPLSADMGDDTAYTALSYVWGEEQNSHLVFVGNEVLPVGRNLDSTLRHLRRRDRPLRLWVDALCINQNDVEERNHQVHQMRRIYESARDTIIYLGDDMGGNTSLAAWNFLERNSAWALNCCQERDYSIPAAREDAIDFRGDLHDLCYDVFSSPWFTRVWVLQEAVVSRELLLQRGHRRVPWDDFVKVLLVRSRTHDPYGESLRQQDQFEAVRRIWEARVAYQLTKGHENRLPSWFRQSVGPAHASTNMLSMLVRARQLRASDPRDKLFALLGISTGFDWEATDTLDYSKDVSQVYTDFARDFMTANGDYNVLSYGGTNRYDAKEVRLLSWVPDWAHRTTLQPRAILEAVPAASPGQPGWTPHIPEEFRGWTAGDILAVQGRVLGTVTARLAHTSLWGRDEANFETLRGRWAARNKYRKYPLEAQILSFWGQHLDLREGRRAYEPTNVDITKVLESPPGSCGPRRWGPLSLLDHLDVKTCPPARGSIEEYLVARSHKTVEWSDENNPAARVVVDRNSIIEGRLIGLYNEVTQHDTDQEPRGSGATSDSKPHRLVLLPYMSHAEDLIVYLPGARVPFLFRPAVEPAEDRTQLDSVLDNLRHLDGTERLLHGRLVGECWINGFHEIARCSNKFDSVFCIS